MAFPFRYEQPGRQCAGHEQPGTRAVQNALLDYIPGTADRDGGIYNCRNIAGSNSPSVHGEGRAGDTMLPSQTGETLQGQQAVDALLRLAVPLQIQAIIHGRRIWTCDRPYWRTYTGRDPHWNHVHWEQTRWAAAHLTPADVARAFASLTGATPPVRPVPPRTPSAVLGAVLALVLAARKQVLRRGDKNFFVSQLQRLLVARGFYHGKIDGDFGPHTEAAVRAFQEASHIEVDGVVGPQTWAILLPTK